MSDTKQKGAAKTARIPIKIVPSEALKKPARGQLALKVSEKGALSVYGMGRFPVTLYREQWEKLMAMSDQIREFIQANDATLKKKE